MNLPSYSNRTEHKTLIGGVELKVKVSNEARKYTIDYKTLSAPIRRGQGPFIEWLTPINESVSAIVSSDLNRLILPEFMSNSSNGDLVITFDQLLRLDILRSIFEQEYEPSPDLWESLQYIERIADRELKGTITFDGKSFDFRVFLGLNLVVEFMAEEVSSERKEANIVLAINILYGFWKMILTYEI